MRLGRFDAREASALLDDMRAEAVAAVSKGAPGAEVSETRTAFMRYVGQGHEIPVAIPVRALVPDDASLLRQAFDDAYRGHYGRTIPGVEVEILSWALTVSAIGRGPERRADPEAVQAVPAAPFRHQDVFDTARRQFVGIPVYRRTDLVAGSTFPGPALVVEAQTTTVVPEGFGVRVDRQGNMVMNKADPPD